MQKPKTRKSGKFVKIPCSTDCFYVNIILLKEVAGQKHIIKILFAIIIYLKFISACPRKLIAFFCIKSCIR